VANPQLHERLKVIAAPSTMGSKRDSAQRAGRGARGTRTVVVAVAAALVGWVLGRSERNLPAQSPQESASVATSRAQLVSQDTPLLSIVGMVAVGYVTSIERGVVAAQVSARLTHVMVAEGDIVTSGQVVARLDDAVAQAALRTARMKLETAKAQLEESNADVELAKEELRQADELARDGFASRQAVLRAQARLRAVQSRLATANSEAASMEAEVGRSVAELGRYQLRSPIDGVVLSQNAFPGEVPWSDSSSDRSGVLTVASLKKLQVEADVSERMQAGLHVGLPATLTFEALPSIQAKSRVTRVLPAVDRNRATVKVQLAVVDQVLGIRPGMAVQVRFERPNGETGK
jgi:HlyD family secretion protein